MRKKLFTMRAASVALSFCLAAQGIAYGAAEAGGQGWQQNGSDWQYYNAEGQAVTGWLQTSTGWYYLSLEDGKMLTGWQRIDGCYYYLNTKADGIEGRLRSGWLKDADGNVYFLNTVHDGSYGKMLTGWHWIDGYCYYFEVAEGESQGRLVTGRETPDGYLTDAQGRWVESDGTVHYEVGKGIPSEEVKETAARTGSSSRSGGSGGSGGGGGSSSDEDSSGGSDSGDTGTDDNNPGTDITDPEKPGTDITDPEKPGTDITNPEKPGTDITDPEKPGTDITDPEKPGTDITDPEEPGTEEEDEALLFEERTRLVSLGWVQYAVVAFRDGTVDDYTISVDGVDITDACTNVDDAGTIVKWETTVWNPGEVSVTRDSDQKSQTVVLSSGSGPAVETAGDTESTPAAILTNGAVSVFDYYLDVYDKDGNVRTNPDYTTFDLTGERGEASAEVPADYYAPDALITPDGVGEVVVKFALDTEERENWFGNLSNIKVLSEENNILNRNVPFEKTTETTYGNTGVIRISLPQTNFYARGQYQLNFSSDYSSETLTIPIQLVDNRQFKLSLSELNPNPQPGECFEFNISGPNGETFGNEILSPIYRVDLGMPSGTVKTLTEIDDWYEIGNKLHICGTNNTSGEVNTDESGVYTITVYANGYKTMTTLIEIGSAQAGVQAAAGTMTSLDAGVDAVSSASLGGSGGSSDEGSGGGGSINAYLIFDHDLLSNAMILNEIGVANADAQAVVALWGEQKAVSVMDENAETLYDFVHYLNAVRDTKLSSGEYLTYREYTQKYEDGITPNFPYQIKKVLEDGKLGSTTSFGDLVGTGIPAISGTEAMYGDDLVLIAAEDSDYISRITELYLDGSGTALRSDDYLCEYEISEDGTTLTIFSKAKGTGGGNTILTAGSHTLEIVADGYKTANITLNITAVLEEFELSLADPNPAASADAEDASAYYTGQSVYINAASSADDDSQQGVRGDFISKLTGVQLVLPDGSRRTVFEKGVGSLSGRDNYEKDGYTIILQEGLFEAAGEYTVRMTAEGYLLKTLTFTVLEAAEIPENPDGKAVPESASAEYKEQFYGPDYYLVSFSGLGEEALAEYLASEDLSVTVNGEAYEKIGTISWADEKRFAVAKNYDTASGYIYLHLTADGFTEEVNTVTIKAEGYQTFTFTVGESSETPENPDEKAAPESASAELKKQSYGPDYYLVSFSGLGDEALAEYLASEDLSVTVNGEAYEKIGSISWAYEKQFAVAKNYDTASGYIYLHLTADGFTEEVNTVTIEAEGYQTFTFTVGEAAETPENPDEKAAPESASAEYKEQFYGPDYYLVSFSGLEEEALAEYLASEDLSVTVNGEAYSKTYSISSADGKQFAVARNYDTASGYIYLHLTADGFTETVNTVEIEAEGYEPFSFTVETDGDNTGDDGDLKAAPEVAGISTGRDIFVNYYEITFKDLTSSEVQAYVAEAEISVNGTPYREAEDFLSSGTYKTTIDGHGNRLLRLAGDGFTEDANEIVIVVAGYEDLVVICDKNGKILDSDEAISLELDAVPVKASQAAAADDSKLTADGALSDGTAAEDVIEDAVEDVTEDVIEDAAEDVTEDVIEDAAGDVTEDAIEDAAEDVTEDAAEDAAEDVTEDVAEDASEDDGSDETEIAAGQASEDDSSDPAEEEDASEEESEEEE